MKRTTQWLAYTGGFLLLLMAVCASGAYCMLYGSNFTPEETTYVYIYEDDKDFCRLCRELCDSAGCENRRSFEWLAKLREYPSNMKSGRYAVEPGMSNHVLLDRLRCGRQTPVRLTFNNVRLISDLIEKFSAQLMPDREDFIPYLGDEDYCATLGFNTTTVKAMFIPNTYEVYWNIAADKLLERMKREYDTFWTVDRLKKAENMRLSPVQVSILASIVEEETAVADEYPVIAGLYINRLIKAMMLQADPTVKYAVGDFSLKRILRKHLETESPYNTYLHGGLPPGPIRIPSIRGIDAVLDYTHHNYLYMCAKEDFSGRHNFAVTLKEHNRNAEKYRAELQRKGIR